MTSLRILHNPRCSKSRQTLQLLQDKGLEPEVVEYLKDAPSPEELAKIAKLLEVESFRDMMRTKEAEYKEQGLGNASISEQQLLQAMHDTPKLIERPIVVHGDKAKIGRPPEAVLDIL